MKNHVILCTFLVSWIILASSWSQESCSELESQFTPPKTHVLVQDAQRVYHTSVGLITAPLNFKRTEWTRLALIAGGTVLLFTVDESIQRFSQDHQSSFNDQLFNIDRYYGNLNTGFFASATYVLGYVINNEKVRLAGLHSMEAFFYAGLITSAIKTLLGRRRPYGGENNMVFKPFQWGTLYTSLPSGHATIAFAVSSVMAKSVDCLAWKSFWYGGAGLVSMARVYHNKHSASDVFLGSMIGYLVANYVVNFNRKPYTTASHRIRFYVAANRMGVRVAFP